MTNSEKPIQDYKAGDLVEFRPNDAKDNVMIRGTVERDAYQEEGGHWVVAVRWREFVDSIRDPQQIRPRINQ